MIEVEQLILAAHYADLNGPYDVDDHNRVLAGEEEFYRLGGDGTPEVAEFAPAELGAVQGMGAVAATNLVADALDLRHRHPRMWQLVLAGEVPAWKARKVVQKAHHLDLAAAWFVDSAVAGYVNALPWARFEAFLAAKIIEADPDAAEERRKAKAAARFVRTGQSNEYGLKTLVAQADAGDVIFFVAVCDRLARVLGDFGDSDSLDQRRSKALGILANPARALELLEQHAAWAAAQSSGDTSDTSNHSADSSSESGTDSENGAGREYGAGSADADHESDAGEAAGAGAGPARCRSCGAMTGDPTAFTRPSPRIDASKLLQPATLYIHLSEGSFRGDEYGVARLEGAGPVTVEQARLFLRNCNVTVKPVIDVADQAPVDGYEVPPRLREAIFLRNPADVFPYAARVSRRMDLDHTRPYSEPHGEKGTGPPGRTGMDNLGPLTRRHHRIKTHGRWGARQPWPRTYLWRTPHGYYFLVDHHGTTPLDQAAGRALWETTRSVRWA